MRTFRRATWTFGCASLAAGTACLPEDTRPPPAELVITASASDLTLGGIPSAITSDGFTIQFERVLVNLGDEDLSGSESECNDYSVPAYTRLFDFARVESPQEVGIAYGLGSCAPGFGVSAPTPDSKLGLGASADDRDAMRIPASDHVARHQGVSVWVSGSGTRGTVRKHFSWPFRMPFRYESCGADLGSGTPRDGEGDAAGAGNSGAQGLTLRSDSRLEVDIQIEIEELFQDHADPQYPGQHFEPYLTADADGDGEITFEELWSVPLATVREQGLYVPKPNLPGDGSELLCFDDRDETYPVKTLGDYVYCVLLPRVTRYQGGGKCELSVSRASGEGL